MLGGTQTQFMAGAPLRLGGRTTYKGGQRSQQRASRGEESCVLACGPRPGRTVRESLWPQPSRLPVPLGGSPSHPPSPHLAGRSGTVRSPPSGTRPARDSASLSTSSAPSLVFLDKLRKVPLTSGLLSGRRGEAEPQRELGPPRARR